MKYLLNLAKVERLLRHQLLSVRHSFWEPTQRGYEYPPPPSKYTLTEHVIRGYGVIFDEFKLWLHEIREKFIQDRKQFRHGDTDVVFRFDSEDALKKWGLSSDSMNKEGNSECHLIINNNRKAVFYGNVDTTVPKDGRAKRAGYCTMKSKKLKKSFQRPDWFEWESFTHLELRVKGDGRSYAVILGLGHLYDLLWLDIYTYNIYTHGGPYWQTIRVPFSKFFLTSKGRIQDRQEPVPRCRIDSVGITCFGVPGPFRLEIDYIGVHLDLSHNEKFAYELYNYPKYIVSN